MFLFQRCIIAVLRRKPDNNGVLTQHVPQINGFINRLFLFSKFSLLFLNPYCIAFDDIIVLEPFT